MTNVSRCMSTQHPDNATTPFFADQEVIRGETEVKEAYYVFSHLDCREQMWDCEGKDVDSFVIEKLLMKYPYYFRKNKLGKDVFITLRVPNPAVEKSEGKVLLETLESIPRNFDIARGFNRDIAPIFEVILPMTRSHEELNRVFQYYKKVVVGKEKTRLGKGGMTIASWIGDFNPKEINVIPLVEDYDSLLNSHLIAEKYLEDKKPEYQRIFLARSDPALNYGSVAAVLLIKIALQRLYSKEEKLSVPILPILGVGSAPFRGNLKPTNILNCTTEYPSVQTFTIQSSFKYDHPERVVRESIESLNNTKRGKPLFIDERGAFGMIGKVMGEYQKEVEALAFLVNKICKYVPKKRARKLHIGLFGYARSVKGITLPRAIDFCASLYSLGIPPELLGLSALSERDFDALRDIYVHVEEDLEDAFCFANKNNFKYLSKDMRRRLEKALKLVDSERNKEYEEITERIAKDLRKGNYVNMSENIQKAAIMRSFLG
jgi:phosphoenolpyruvate carboxylase